MQFGDCEETVVVSNSANDSDCLALIGLLGGLSLGLADNTRDGDWRSVDAGLKQALENDFVEVGVSATCAWAKLLVCCSSLL